MKRFFYPILITIVALKSCGIVHKQSGLDELLISGDWAPLSMHIDSIPQSSNNYLIRRTSFIEGKISSVHVCSLDAWQKKYDKGFLIETSFINCYTDCLAIFKEKKLYQHRKREEFVENGVVYLIVYEGVDYFYSSPSTKAPRNFSEFDSIAMHSYLIRID